MFDAPKGASEYFLVVESGEDSSFRGSLCQVEADYRAALRQLGLSEATQVLLRAYLSDTKSQYEILAKSGIYELCKNSAFSVIQQPPLHEKKLILFAYHLRGGEEPIRKDAIPLEAGCGNAVVVRGKHYDLLCGGSMCCARQPDAHGQTDEIFASFKDLLARDGMTLLDNAIRTWIYVGDIGENYAGMVTARKDFFGRNGLTQDTRYIASTGIGAVLPGEGTRISMDALAIGNLRSEQMIQMTAPEYLCPTHKYGVTFERGTKIVFGDRTHFHISGTASIDREGDIVHTGDARRQSERTLENVSQLLSPHGASLEDMAYLVVYIRDSSDAGDVRDVLVREIKKEIPVVLLNAPVCRKDWLVEVEGIAIRPCDSAFQPFQF